MTNAYILTQQLWRVIPEPLKRLVRSVDVLDDAKRAVARIAGRADPHNRIYNDTYYVTIEQNAQRAASAVVDSVIADFQPRSVLDVGCGTGAFLEGFRERGVGVAGIDYSEAALAVCRQKRLPIRQHDLERDELPEVGTFDVVISTEVAEHLPESCADRFVALLCASAKTVVFTAATPGQPGEDHVNAQPNEYWIERFARCGCAFDETRALRWREAWRRREVPDFYIKNLMIFWRQADDR
jgi:SAM-dependent methyltransferase